MISFGGNPIWMRWGSRTQDSSTASSAGRSSGGTRRLVRSPLQRRGTRTGHGARGHWQPLAALPGRLTRNAQRRLSIQSRASRAGFVHHGVDVAPQSQAECYEVKAAAAESKTRTSWAPQKLFTVAPGWKRSRCGVQADAGRGVVAAEQLGGQQRRHGRVVARDVVVIRQ